MDLLQLFDGKIHGQIEVQRAEFIQGAECIFETCFSYVAPWSVVPFYDGFTTQDHLQPSCQSLLAENQDE